MPLRNRQWQSCMLLWSDPLPNLGFGLAPTYGEAQERAQEMRHERRADESVDVSASPELLRLAEEVQTTGKSRELRRGHETLALIVPFSATGARRHTKRELTARDMEAFRAAAGSWSDVDVERFLADVYTARDVPDERRVVDL
jgi:hypothetical protein